MLVGGWLFVLLGLVGGAAAGTSRGAPRPRPHHLGIVVTAGEVFVSWRVPRGLGAAKVLVRRGQPTCPRTPADGVAAGAVYRRHVMDRSVKAGFAYCYAVFLVSAGGVTTAGSTGAITVPDTRVVPPGHVIAPAPVPATTRFDSALAKQVAVVAGGGFTAALLLLVFVRTARRVGEGRLVLRPHLPGSLVGRPLSTLVVPVMIMLGWIIMIAFVVVLR
ncbi:MAG TPA: hypothetical protein VE777_00945 [Gaiellales bacterium]|jgi:hypothetical protein|nr:hypothetical protein [Gaiellales bacterium]